MRVRAGVRLQHEHVYGNAQTAQHSQGGGANLALAVAEHREPAAAAQKRAGQTQRAVQVGAVRAWHRAQVAQRGMVAQRRFHHGFPTICDHSGALTVGQGLQAVARQSRQRVALRLCRIRHIQQKPPASRAGRQQYGRRGSR